MRPYLYAAAALLIVGISAPASAAVAVIDVANLGQAVQQVTHHITQIQHQLQQIRQLQTQIDSINGSRGLGAVHNDPRLKNYVSPDALQRFHAVSQSGYAALSSTAKALRDAQMDYNCLDLQADAKRRCQSTLAQPYEHQGQLQDALRSAAGRIAQIEALMRAVNNTTDQKSVQEIQARLSAENALLAHEATQLQMLQDLADSEERIARSRERERQYQMLSRTGKIADHLR